MQTAQEVVPQVENPEMERRSSRLPKILILLLLLILLGFAVFWVVSNGSLGIQLSEPGVTPTATPSQAVSPTPTVTEVGESIFLANAAGDNTIRAFAYDFTNDNVLFSETVNTVDSLWATAELGSNKVIQYLPSTNELYYLTSGSDLGCEVGCTPGNADGTTETRLYRQNLEVEQEELIKGFGDIPGQGGAIKFAVNPQTGIVYVFTISTEPDNEYKLFSIDSKSQTETELLSQTFVGIEDFPQVSMLSFDNSGENIYVAIGIQGDIVLTRVNLASKKTVSFDIPEKEFASPDWGISPDGNHYGYYADTELFVYKLKEKKQSKVTIKGKLENVGLIWMGDNQLINNFNAVYDPVSKKNFKLQDTFSYIEAPGSQSRFVYLSNGGKAPLKIYDFSAKSDILGLPDALQDFKDDIGTSNPFGLSWF